MIIIILLNLLFYYIAAKNHLFSKKKTRIILFLGFLVEILLFVIYRVSLYYMGREVYFSDAETYWKNTLEILYTGSSTGYNGLYYYICAIVQKASPFIWVGWNNLFNITCLNLSFVMIAKFIKEKDKDEKKLQLFTFLSLMNPFIIFGLMRNLKDSLFLLIVISVCFITNQYIQTKSQKTKVLIILALLFIAYIFTDIRPWGFIIPIVAILYIIQHPKRQKYIFDRKSVLILLGVALAIGVAIIFAIPAISNNIRIWTPITFSSLADRGIFTTIVGLGKFVIAPGPIRAFLGGEFFEHSMSSGNIMAGIGEIMWWLSLIPIVITVLIQRQKIFNIKTWSGFLKILVFSTLAYIIIYTMQYGGSGELRLKSVFYVLSYAIFFQIFDIVDFKKHRAITIIVTILMTAVFAIISASSLTTG